MPLRLRVIPPASTSRGAERTPSSAERSVDFDDGVGQIRIGRRPDLEMSLPFSPLSGVHARLVRSDDKTQWLLEDLGSTNGTFVAGERLKPGVKHPVLPGTRISLAEIKLIFDGEVKVAAHADVTRAVNLDARGAALPVRGTPVKGVEAPAFSGARGTPVRGVEAPGMRAPRGTPVKGVEAPAFSGARGTPVRGVEAPGMRAPRGTPVKGVEAPAFSGARGTPVKGVEAPPRSEKRGTPVKGVEAPPRSEVRGTPVKGVEAPPRSEVRGTPVKGVEAPPRSAPPAPNQLKGSEPPARGVEPPAKGLEPTETFVRRPTSGMPAHAPAAVPVLTAVAGIKDGATTFRLEQKDHPYMFGRTRRCEFRVKTSEVSREHASFTRRTDGIYVTDLGSVNGVLVNNTRVNEFRLYDGDLIQIGHVRLRLFDPTETGGRGTDSAAHTPSRLAPHGAEQPVEPPPDRSATWRSEFHPAIAGALAAEGGHRERRQSVRIMFTQTWERSSRFRYGVVIIAASVIAVCAVILAFEFAG